MREDNKNTEQKAFTWKTIYCARRLGINNKFIISQKKNFC